MKRIRFARIVCLLLALWMSSSALVACQNEPDTPQPNPPTQGEQDTDMETILLNGEWQFFRDERAKSGSIKGMLSPDSASGLTNGETLTFKLNVDQPAEAFYSKLRFHLTFGNALATEDAAIWAQVNDGAWFKTEIGHLAHNRNSCEHTVDVGLYFVDLVAGENTVRLRSNVSQGELTVSKQAAFPLELCYYPVLMFPDRLQPITVPGVWETQLGGDYTAYDGVGWYQTTFDLPTLHESNQWVLTFDGIDYAAEIWINDRFICSHEDGYTPIVIDLAAYADFLQTVDNRLTVRVTDQSTEKNAEFPLKQTLAGFYHDSVGINFGGIWNDVYLSCRGKVRVDDVTINTDVDTMTLSLTALLKSMAEQTDIEATLTLLDGDTVVGSKHWQSVAVGQDGYHSLEATLDVADAACWEISAPKLYTARIELRCNGVTIDTHDTTFGFTSIRTEENKILFNNRAIKLNGVLSWLGNWEQISPRFDEAVFTEQIRALKEYGFNAIKFCLVVPPEALLDICDREGIYVYIEYPVWNPVQTDAFYERAYSQMRRMIAMSKNHPSVIMSDFNCEMQVFDDAMLDFMNWCVSTGKQLDQNRLFADNSSTGRQNYDGENDFWTWHPYTNALGFADYAKSVVANRTAHGEKPLVFGEYADYPALADVDAILAANNGNVPWNWNVVDDPFRADLYLSSLGYSHAQIQQIIAASQQNCIDMKMYYVQETKKADEVAAYFLTIIQDIGHSVAGFFDELGNQKFTAEQTAFLQESVLLLQQNVYSFTAGAQASITPAISHYNGFEIENGTLRYALLDENGTVADEGVLDDNVNLENGSYLVFDRATIRIPEVSSATRYTLALTLQAAAAPEISNRWEIYVYPEAAAATAMDGKTIMTSGSGAAALKQRYDNVTDWKNGAEPDLLIAFDRLTDAQLTYLKNGGKVLYLGTGSEAVRVEQGTFYSQYVMVHFPQEHEITSALASKGYGGLQFLRLQTQHVITEDKDDPLSHSIIGKLLLRDNVGDIGQSASYMSEFAIGNGTLIQSTLDHSGDRILGNYLIDLAAAYLLQASHP